MARTDRTKLAQYREAIHQMEAAGAYENSWDIAEKRMHTDGWRTCPDCGDEFYAPESGDRCSMCAQVISLHDYWRQALGWQAERREQYGWREASK